MEELVAPQKELDEPETDYANNAQFSPNVWDLKILFGELSIRNTIDWHTSITLPWAQAKLMAYYLEVNVRLRETNFGKIQVPSVMVPPPPPELSGVDLENPKLVEFSEWIKAYHQSFIDSLK